MPAFPLSRKPAPPRRPLLAAAARLACAALVAAAPVAVLAQADPGSADRTFSLEEAMAYAERNTPAVRAAMADLAEADGQIKETLSIGLPKVNGSVGYTHYPEIPQQLFPDFISPTVLGVLNSEQVVNSGTGQVVQPFMGEPGFTPVAFGLKNQLQAGVNVNSLLFDATYFIALRGSRLYRSLAVRTLEQTAYQSRVQVAKAYLATLIAQRNLEQLQRNVDNLETTLSETRALYEAGFAEKLSVDRLELTASNLAAQRESILQVIGISTNLLKFQMGYPQREAITLADDLDAALGSARLTELLSDDEFDPAVRPEIATLQVADSLAAIDLKRIQAGYYPNLVGFAGISRTLNRNDLFDGEEAGWLPASSLGVTLNVPIFDGFEKRAQRQRALARADKTRVQIRRFEQSARLALANARAAVRNARIAVDLRENSIALAEEIYRVSQIKFREGVGSSLEVNQAQGELFRAQDALTQALYDLAVAYTDYQDALGEL